jgi:short-subunit dehydrogenase involved in D-alanine esterification of teichoic acids
LITGGTGGIGNAFAEAFLNLISALAQRPRTAQPKPGLFR